MEREVLLDVKDLDVTFGERRKRYEAVKKLSLIHISEPTRH